MSKIQLSRHHGLWMALALAITIFDQWTKFLALSNLELHRPVPVFPTFDLMLTFNTGAAFSFLSDAGGWQRWFFIVLALGISVFLVRWILTLTANDNKWLAAGLSLLLGGAIGNLIDRIFRDGRVVDFLYFHYRDFHFPAFNLADSAICVGAGVLIAHTFLVPQDNQDK